MARKVIKEFYTPTCGQCPQQERILEEVTETRDDVTLQTIDATENLAEANQYSVQSVPTTVVLDADGTVLSQFTGVTPADDIATALDG